MDCSLSGFSVHGILQGSILEWVAISFSRRSSGSRDWTHVSCLAGGFFTTERPGKPSRWADVNFFPNFIITHGVDEESDLCLFSFTEITSVVILVSRCLCNKVPQVWWLKTTGIFYLLVWKQSLRSITLGWNQVAKDVLLLGTLGQNLFLYCCSFL